MVGERGAAVNETIDEDIDDSVLRGVAAAPPRTPPIPAPTGQTIGRYRVLGLLGRGGMGAVYEAVDTELGRHVAMKFARSNSVDHARAYNRFRRERAITAELEHPNIMPIYDIGVAPSGEPYYVMRVAPGEPLDQRIAKAATIEARLALLPNLIAVSDAIAFAHSRGIIHRDIKPHNVLVGAFGETLVADWGLAKHVSQPHDEATNGSHTEMVSDTAVGEVVGTPAYMAPEQARGGVVDERTDVFALGAMLFYLLVQQPPPSAWDEMNAALVAVRVSTDLIAIASKALRIDPAARYQRSKEVADDLRRFLAGQIVGARSYTRTELIRRWARRNRPELSVGASFGALLVVLAIGGVVRIVDERDQAQAERTAAETSRAESMRHSEDLVLLQARAELTHDPTAAVAWLARYPVTAPHWDIGAGIATDAASRTCARHVWDLGRPVTSVAVSPDNQVVAASAADGTLVLIEIATGTRRTFHADDGVGNRIVFTPDGTHIATTDGYEVVRIWDRASGGSRKLSGTHIGGANIQFSADGSLVFVRHAGGGARMWRVADGEPVVLPGTADERLLSFVPGTRALAIVTGHELMLFDLDAGKRLARIDLDGHPYDMAASGDGRWIAVSRFDALQLWNPATNELRRIAPGKEVVGLITPSSDGASFMSCGFRERELWRFDVGTATSSRVSTNERCFRQAFSFSHDSSAFLSAGLGGEVRLHLLAEGTMRAVIGHDDAISDAAFSPDDRLVVSGSSDHTVRLWEWTAGDVRVFHQFAALDRVAANGLLLVHDRVGIEIVDVHTGSHTTLPETPSKLSDGCMSRDGSVVALVRNDRTIAVYDVDANRHRTLPGVRDLVHTDRLPTGCSSRGDRMVQVDGNGVVRISDLSTGELRAIARLPDAGAHVLFSDDDRFLAVAGRDGSVVILEPVTGTELARTRLAARAWNLGFSRDGGRVVAPCNEGVVRVLDIATAQVRDLRGHVGAVAGAAFTADGKRVFSSGVDGTVRVWDLATGTNLIVRREPSPINAINFVGATGLVVHGSHDTGLIRVWDATSLPPLDVDPAKVHAWIRRATSAQVDDRGVVRTPP